MTIRVLDENTKGVDYFVGDIHGCYDILMDTLYEVKFCPQKDRLICTGDLIDRGPDSVKCVELLKEPWFFSVRGNHDQFLLDGVSRGQVATWVMNGGMWHYYLSEDELKDLYHLIDTECTTAIRVPYKGKNVGVIHANVTSGIWGEFDDERDIWDRSRTRVSEGVFGDVKGIDLVVVGHTVVDFPQKINNVLHIDTGAVFDGRKLTVMSIEEVLSYE